MSGESARRLVKTLSDCVMARETLVSALPPESTITITVKTDRAGLTKSVTFATHSGGDVQKIRQPELNGH